MLVGDLHGDKGQCFFCLAEVELRTEMSLSLPVSCVKLVRANSHEARTPNIVPTHELFGRQL